MQSSRARFPARQLNSRTIKSAALCYLSPVVLGKCSITSAKCVCRVQESGFQDAWNSVCRTRDACDSALRGMKNVAFFFSAISTQKLKKQRDKKKSNDHDENEDSDDADEYPELSQLASSTSQQWAESHASIINHKLCPAVSYWIASTTPNGAPRSPLGIHRVLLECNVDVFINQVACHEGKESGAMKELFKVLKDHNNTFMVELVNSSYKYCFRDEFESVLGEADSIDVDECGTENVVRICLVDPSFHSSLSVALGKLQIAKLVIEHFGFHVDGSDIQTGNEPVVEKARLSDKLTVLVNDIGIAMEKLGYALYAGKIYKKCEKARYTYWYKCEVEAFVNSLAANRSFKARLLKDMKKVIEILANPHCEVIRPLCVDYDLIEVNEGQCWSIKERRFLENAIKDKDIGHVTPRAFSPYDPTKVPDPKYFREILENSLTEAEVGEFCEDFIRLLHHNQKRHKDKVPCLIGAANSGKTSLFQPILGLVHHSNIATITKQRVFNKAMINRFTEVIFIDEASPSTLDIDDWKILTQGGFTACDVKYQTAKSFINRCPMLLTAQTKLEFKADDQPAMDRRLKNYTFKSLPNPRKKATEWLRRHPMECVAWAATKARPPSDQEESSDNGEDEQEPEIGDGVLKAEEKDALRTLSLLEESCEDDSLEETNEAVSAMEESNGEPDTLQDHLSQLQPGSLRHRQMAHILETEKEKQKQIDQFYRTRDVERYEDVQTAVDQDEARGEAARKAFEGSWLRDTEIELKECCDKYQATQDSFVRSNVKAWMEVLCEKLKAHHQALGTFNTIEAIEERKKVCTALGLLRKEDHRLVTSVAERLPVLTRPSADADEIVAQQDVSDESSQERRLFITPVPSTSRRPLRQHDDCAVSEALLRASSTLKRKRGSSSQRGREQQRNTITKYLSSTQHE
ncbi:hypothetical protein ACROYT_G020049 [Oculina patagonica]